MSVTPDPSPWAGDDIPASSGADEIIWSVEAPDSTPSTPPSLAARGWLIIAVSVTAVIMLGVAAAAAWPSGDGSAEDPVETSPTTPTTLSTLPSAVTTTPPTTSPVRTTIAVDRTVATLPPSITIDLPPQFDSAVSTQVVALTALGQLVNLDTLTGTATTIDLDDAPGRRQSFGTEVLVASPDAIMVNTADGSILVIVDGADVPVAIDRDDFVFDSSEPPVQIVPFGWVTSGDGGTEFVVIAVEQSSGRQREWLVDTDGNVALALAQRSGNFSTPVFAQGTRFLNDAGGAYRVDPEGSTQRVSSGSILAASADRILLRECDARRFCNSVLRDHDGNDVVGVDLPPTFSPTFFGASLSPDATAIASPSQSFDSGRTLYDLATGAAVTYDNQRLGPFGNTWATDSSGEFSLDGNGGLVFLDRSSGDEIAFGEELGELLVIAVRTSGSD